MQLVPSKLVTSCNTRFQYSRCRLTKLTTHSQLLREKPNKYLNEKVRHLGSSFEAIAHQL